VSNEKWKMENRKCEANQRYLAGGRRAHFAFSVSHYSILILLLLLSLLGANRIEPKRCEGFTEPYQTIDVAAAEIGIVQDVRVELGQLVKKAEVLGTLDEDVLKATLEIARVKAESTAGINAATAELELKQQRLNALAEINRNGEGSREEFSRAKADAELARAKLKAAEETLAADRLELKKIEAQLHRRTIRSPIDGVVTEIHRDPGEFVSLTEPKLFNVVRLDRLRAKFYVPAEQSVRFSKGQRVKLSGQADEKPLTADVEFVSPITHAESGLVRVDVILDNRDGRLRSGQRLTLVGE
jgi:RND family efflux transporter MFP subunit